VIFWWEPVWLCVLPLPLIVFAVECRRTRSPVTTCSSSSQEQTERTKYIYTVHLHFFRLSLEYTSSTLILFYFFVESARIEWYRNRSWHNFEAISIHCWIRWDSHTRSFDHKLSLLPTRQDFSSSSYSLGKWQKSVKIALRKSPDKSEITVYILTWSNFHNT